MQNVQNYAVIDFHGRKMTALLDGGEVRVAVRPICEMLGLDWSRQLQKIKDDPILSQAVGLTPTAGEGNGQSMITLPLKYVQGWLFRINANKVKEELREFVITTQRELYQVLHDYATKGFAINPRFAQTDAAMTSQVANTILKLMRELRVCRDVQHRFGLIALLDKSYRSLDIEPPILSAIGYVLPNVIEGCKPFFDLIADLEAKGVPLNHHRMGNRLAINWTHLEALALEHGFDMDVGKATKQRLKLHPRFIDSCTVNSLNGSSVHCWVFERGH